MDFTCLLTLLELGFFVRIAANKVNCKSIKIGVYYLTKVSDQVKHLSFGQEDHLLYFYNTYLSMLELKDKRR